MVPVEYASALMDDRPLHGSVRGQHEFLEVLNVAEDGHLSSRVYQGSTRFLKCRALVEVKAKAKRITIIN